jgi:hypothetical protein
MSRDGSIDPLQKAEKLLMAMTGLAGGEDSTGGDVERGKQGGGAMANMIVGNSLHIAQPHGQHRLVRLSA